MAQRRGNRGKGGDGGKDANDIFVKFCVFAVGGTLVAIPFFGMGPLLVVFAALAILAVFFKNLGN